jgi:aspartate aminotransferase
MTQQLSSRIRAVPSSATLAMTQRAAELRAQGVDVLAFGVGEPDFDTPAHIREATKRAIDEGVGSYTRVRGIDALREAIRDDSARRRGGQAHDLEEIVVSVGAKHTLFNLAMVLLDPGDEVIVPAPYWVSYPSQVTLAGATPRVVETSVAEGFRLSPEALEEAIGERTKALVLCSPSNPTGAAYAPEHLEALAAVLRKHENLWVIVDEIYAELVYDGFDQRSILEVAPDLRDRLVVVDGVSKTYAMTGWRIGWMLGPAPLAKAVEKLQGQSTTNPAAVAQHAALAALRGEREPIERMREAFAERRRVILDGLTSIEGVSCREPEGAFYAFPNFGAFVGKRAGGDALEDDLALATYLLDEARCAVVPGSAFGAPGFARLSYATDMETIRQGVSRIGEALGKLS